MTNIAHAVLAGSDLHEPKGIGSAAINTSYIANGAGSGAWSLIPAAALSPGANAFGGGLFHVREQQSSGVGSTSPTTSSAWSTRILNTVMTNDTGTPSLSANQITLPAGTYWSQARAVHGAIPSAFTVVFRIKLRNITTSADLVLGIGQEFFVSSGSGQMNIVSDLYGRFTLAGTSVIELQQWCVNCNAGIALGIPTTSEVYSDVMVWKTA